MTAEEMFENLGYIKSLPKGNLVLDYTKSKKSGNEEKIVFDLEQKEISVYSWIYNELSFLDITQGMLNAINMQVKELKEAGKW